MYSILPKGKWNNQRGKFKKVFVILTENDFIYKEGGKDDMIENLQRKLGETKEELLKIIRFN